MKPTDTLLLEGSVHGDATTVTADPATGAAQGGSVLGYRIRESLGRGGMGEVILALDERIGRDVAIKRLHGAPSPNAVKRFLREARIQARLEHPAIVPVHELGHDSNGDPFFTMKRLAGITLAALLRTTPPPPNQRLLRAFAEVCSAVEFAHSHQVVHRDLKPANIMLGDFGEVYVLDWGLAREGTGDRDSIDLSVESLDGMTQAGAVMGTPGYMAPEQVRGESVAAPADVYALGSILFEILAGQALHPPGPPALLSTLAPFDRSPTKRAPDRGIPPELDELCVAALASEASARPSAKELASQITSYLDGDRDLERRRELSATSLAKARRALAMDEIGGRAEAMHEAGRALALDPESRDAAELVTRLMLEPPRQLPEALVHELGVGEAAVQQRQSRVALLSFVAIASFLLMVSWNGIRNYQTFIAVATLTSAMAGAAYLLSHRRARVRDLLVVTIGNAALVALLSRAFGSLILTPAVTCIMAVSLTSYPQLIDRAKTVIAILALSWIAPVMLELAGVLDPTWSVTDRIVSTSTMITIGEVSTTTLLIVANVITILVIGWFANALARSRRDSQRQVEIQAWHLRRLLPGVHA